MKIFSIDVFAIFLGLLILLPLSMTVIETYTPDCSVVDCTKVGPEELTSVFYYPGVYAGYLQYQETQEYGEDFWHSEASLVDEGLQQTEMLRNIGIAALVTLLYIVYTAYSVRHLKL